MRFTCLHCGHCCTNKSVQASITLGDVKRLSEKTGMNASELVMKGMIGIIPSGDPSTNIFETDLGLIYACSFRKNSRCAVYDSRPLNCRLFPVALLTEIPFSEVKDYLDEDFKCREAIVEDRQNLPIMKIYKRALGDLLLKESEATELFLKKHDLFHMINIADHPLFSHLDLEVDDKEIACRKIRFCESILDPLLNERLAGVIDEAIASLTAISSEGMPYLVQFSVDHANSK